MYYLSIFPEQCFMNAVLVVFYMHHLHLSMSEYLYLDGLLFIIISISEIPSGFVADYFGRKRMLIFSQALMIISMILLLVSSDMIGGAISIIVLSFGISLGSGNAGSILYEYFSKNDSIENYKKIYSNKGSIYLVTSSFYSIASGFIFKFSMNLIIYLDIIVMLINIIVTFTYLVDNKPKGTKVLSKDVSDKPDLKIGFKNVLGILPVFLMAGFLFSFFRVTFNYYQPLFESKNIPIELFGFFPVMYNLLAALGSQLYGKGFTKLKKESLQILILLILLVTTIALIYVYNNALVIIISLIFAQQIIRGIYMPFSGIMVNNSIPNETNFRTSYISLYSSISTILVSAFILIAGVISEHVSVISSMLIISAVITGCIVVMFIIYLCYHPLTKNPHAGSLTISDK